MVEAVNKDVAAWTAIPPRYSAEMRRFLLSPAVIDLLCEWPAEVDLQDRWAPRDLSRIDELVRPLLKGQASHAKQKGQRTRPETESG